MSEESEEDNFPQFGLNSDTSSHEDSLGFEPYVSAINEFITADNTEPPLTISIEGDWGSGKTTFMNLLKTSLDDAGHTTVQFNPWRHEDKKAVWAAFASELIGELKETTPVCDRIKSNLSINSTRYWSNTGTWAKIRSGLTLLSLGVLLVAALWIWAAFVLDLVIEETGLPAGPLGSIQGAIGVTGALTIVTGYFKILKTTKSNVVQPLEKNLIAYASDPGYDSKTDFISEFHDDFENILDAYLEDDERVFIFIDDLDRCSVPRAAELMQSINLLMSDDDRLVFILGLDRERVAAGVTAKHEGLLEHFDQGGSNGDLEFGYQYLEKFIQIPFLVPEPKETDIENLITGGNERDATDEERISIIWGEIESELEINIDEIIDMAAPALQSNPRQIKRFLNLFQLRAVVAHLDGVLAIDDTGKEKDDVTLYQLAKFVIISVQWPQLISKLYNDIEALDGLMNAATDNSTDYAGDLKPWITDQALLDLLRYGDGDKFHIRNDQIGSLIKISPRADRPTQSNATDETIPKSVDISIFAEHRTNKNYINRAKIVEEMFISTKIRPEPYSVEPSLKNSNGEAFNGAVWIAGCKQLDDQSFQRMVSKLPAETLLIIDPKEQENLEKVGTAPSDLDHQAIRVIDESDNLEQIIYNHIHKLTTSEENWSVWRNKATEARREFVHGF